MSGVQITPGLFALIVASDLRTCTFTCEDSAGRSLESPPRGHHTLKHEPNARVPDACGILQTS
eukprot:5400852-Pyramimonas_sp.AAC.1